MQDVFLRSGKWRWTVADENAVHGESLELIDPSAPYNKMAVPLPFSWRRLSNDEIAELAREPEIRLWTDEHGIHWRIARIGPETHHPYRLPDPHLVFDSEQCYAGIVRIEPHARLGDLTSAELRSYRDRMRDFGGRRRAFRAPATDPT
ncbi:MAG TPA: hypothetical protein VK966_12770 [Longimicrobiales bacterium]|nr:hypothetical protein [Longimicrobiales bacterium]